VEADAALAPTAPRLASRPADPTSTTALVRMELVLMVNTPFVW